MLRDFGKFLNGFQVIKIFGKLFSSFDVVFIAFSSLEE